MQKFRKLFVDYDLAREGWKKFNYRIDKALSWSEFSYELAVFSERVNVVN